MREELQGSIEGLHIGLVERVARGALVAWALLMAAALAAGWRAAAGVGLGGSVSYGFLALHRALAKRWLQGAGGRRGRSWLWGVWVAKWPLLAVVLFLALREDWVAPLWLCAGVGIVPAVTTGLVVWSVVRDGRSGRGAAGGKL